MSDKTEPKLKVKWHWKGKGGQDRIPGGRDTSLPPQHSPLRLAGIINIAFAEPIFN